jgi:hypothetical protein
MSTTTTTNIATTTQRPADLSAEENFIKKHDGLDATPGYAVVVFEKLERGGAKFAKIVNSDERFKRFYGFWNSPEKYFGVAVNQSVLRYTFAAPVTLDDDIRQFTLIYHLTFRAVDPRKLAELQAQDPLRLLRNMIVETISRACKIRKFDMVKERFRELERLVLDSERARIIQYAETLGTQIISLELDRRLQDGDKRVDKKRIDVDTEKETLKLVNELDIVKDGLLKTKELKVAQTTTFVQRQKVELDHEVIKTRDEKQRERDHESQLHNLDHKYDVQSRELEKQRGLQDNVDELHRRDLRRKLEEAKTSAVSTTFMNVAANINTADGMLDGFGAVQQMTGALREDNGSLGDMALPPGARLGLPAKEDTFSSLLVSVLGEIPRWNYPDAQQRALRSGILHIVAEALLDEEADDTVLQQYVEKLNQLGSSLDPPLSQTQFRLLETFRNTETLRKLLG